MTPQLKKQKAAVIKRWHDRRRRYSFCRRHLKKILALSTKGWPGMTHNRDYLKWLDLVYLAKSRGLYSLKTSTCDIIANMQTKAKQLKETGKGWPRAKRKPTATPG
jgi:hypothetical protein